MNSAKDSSGSPNHFGDDDRSLIAGRRPTPSRLNLDRDEYQHHAVVQSGNGQDTKINSRTVSPLGRNITCVTSPQSFGPSAISDQSEKSDDIAARVTYVKVDMNETCCMVRDIRYNKIYEMSKQLLRSCEYMFLGAAVIADPFLTLFAGLHDQHLLRFKRRNFVLHSQHSFDVSFTWTADALRDEQRSGR